MILLDTDPCVFFLRGRPEVVSALTAHRPDEPAISILTVGELYYGALRSARPGANLARCQEFIDRVIVVGLDETIMRRFAQIKADLVGRGERLEDPDMPIAATAMEMGVALLTHNAAHFSRIGGLSINDWCASS